MARVHPESPATYGLPLEDQVALVLGRMTLRFAALETVCRWWLLQILDIGRDDHPRFEAMLATLPFRRLRAALAATVHDLHGAGPEWKALRPLLARAARVEDRRNVLTHSYWTYSGLPKRMDRAHPGFAASGKMRTDAEAFEDIRQLEDFVQEIDETTKGLSSWYSEMFLGITPESEQLPSE